MTRKRNIFSTRVRKRVAYTVAFQVFFSYMWLRFKRRLFGQQYFERALDKLHVKNAAKIKDSIQELQGLFIKFGQLISNMSNVLPEAFRAPLQELQDHVDEKPYEVIEDTIKKQLGATPNELFDNFNKTPIAAASIGQVHKAEINGEQVVVKIQHHNIDTIAHADLEILKNLVRVHAFFMDIPGLGHTYKQVRQMIEEELDYRKEAEAMQQIAINLKDVPELRVRIPKVYEQYSTSKVLVSSFCAGVNIGHINTLKEWELDLENIAKRLIELYCKMILIDGFYHADPHPGNILVNQSGELVLLDFGAVAHLSNATKKAIPELIEAVIKDDTEGTVLALKRLGFIGSDKDANEYMKKLINIFKAFLENEVELDGLNFQNIKLNSGVSSIAALIRKVDLRDVSNSIRIPKDYILLNRTVVLLIGNAFQLAPQLNTLHVIRPYIKKHILDRNIGLSQLIINSFKNQITTVAGLPKQVSRYLKSASERQLEKEVQSVRVGLDKLYYLGQQFLYVFILIVLSYTWSNSKFVTNAWFEWLLIGLIILVTGLLLKAYYRAMKN